jgi:peptide/nickel transport system substrate-binding protein
MKRRQFLATTAATAATLAAPAVHAADAVKTINFTPQADLALLDPVFTTGLVTRNHGFLVFDQLYGLDESFNPQPQMVEGHVVESDGKTWTITLRDGLVFHDGQKVLARDAVASIQRWGKIDAFGQNLMAVTDELTATSDKTFQFKLKKPFPLLPTALAKPSSYCPVMPERLAKTPVSVQIT